MDITNLAKVFISQLFKVIESKFYSPLMINQNNIILCILYLLIIHMCTIWYFLSHVIVMVCSHELLLKVTETCINESFMKIKYMLFALNVKQSESVHILHTVNTTKLHNHSHLYTLCHMLRSFWQTETYISKMFTTTEKNSYLMCQNQYLCNNYTQHTVTNNI